MNRGCPGAFGNKWHCNFFSHVTERPDAGTDIVLPGGRVQQFNTNNLSVDLWNRNTLTKTNGNLILQFNDSGNKWFFNTNTALEQRLERIEDKYGNALTLAYDSSSGRLVEVQDAVQQHFVFTYNPQGFVTNVSDSFGRSAEFGYDAQGNLTSITDMGGLTTTLQYDTNSWPTNITYPSGQSWTVQYQQGAYGYTNEPFRMSVIDPLSQTNEYFYHGFSYMGPVTVRDKQNNNWVFAHQQVGGENGGQRQYYSGVNATLYRGGPPAYSDMAAHQWQHVSYDADLNPVEMAIAQEQYEGVLGADVDAGYLADVATTNIFDSRHNLLSRTVLTNCVVVGDPPAAYIMSGDIVGVWTNWYDSRDNLLGTENPLGQQTRYGYDVQDHLVAVTNALGQFTLMSYSYEGSLTNLVDTLLRTNRWTYDANGRNYETLYPDGLRITKGYDAIGRLAAVTNHGSSLYLQYFHDSLDRLRDVVFPDGTSNHSEYSCCGLDWTRDRLNRVTTFGRDALGRTTSVTDPESRLTEFRYNGGDQITNLITHVSGQTRVKRFDYTSTNGFSRLAQVATPMGKLMRYDYTFRGGLAWREDGNGRVTKYQYDPLERLVSVTDSNDVPLIQMDYDVLGNVTSVSNAHSVFQYTYDALNRATQAVCLLTNIPGFATVQYKIDYAFDPVGNVTNRLITGLEGFTDTIRTSYGYDVMNRLTNVVQMTNGAATADAWYSYDSAGRLWQKGYGNGDVVTHSYDQESRLLSLGITNGTTLVTCYEYLWDVGGNILAITNNGTNITLYSYDRAGQLTNEICFTNGIAGSTTNSWVYDEAGNWRTGDGKWRLYNDDNELVGITLSNAPVSVPVTVTGHVEPGSASNKWYNTWARVRGQSARVGTSTGDFSIADVPVYPGTNRLEVTVTDASGNQATEVRNVSRTMEESFLYDGNGSLTNWVCGTTNWVYEWDWADRLAKVSSNGLVVLENWYDASSHRIAKAELVDAAPNRALYLFDGWRIAGVANSSGGLVETYTRGVALAGDIGGLVAVTRNPYNSRYYLHSNHRGDVIRVRSANSTLTTYRYSAFGQLLGTTGPDLCRFKFSSKERERSCGLSYYGYRFYAPHWQRWVNCDPLLEIGGWNLFSFVLNAPAASIDALGLAADWPGINRCIDQAFEELKECLKLPCNVAAEFDDFFQARAMMRRLMSVCNRGSLVARGACYAFVWTAIVSPAIGILDRIGAGAAAGIVGYAVGCTATFAGQALACYTEYGAFDASTK